MEYNNIRAVIDAIQNYFAVDGKLTDENAKQLNSQFTEIIIYTNERLRNCDQLLGKGLRGEAIQQSEIEPNLIDLVTELEFPELDDWNDDVKGRGILPAPELLHEVAAEINKSYTQAQSLEKLLKAHRVNALLRSPLQRRIQVLRAIADKDPENPIWQEDLQQFEKTRLVEMEREHGVFLKSKNLSGLEGLLAEVNEPQWLMKPDDALRGKITKSHQGLLVSNARNQLAKIEKEVNSAFSEFNVPAADQARKRWDAYAQIARLGAEDELAMKVQTAFEWLDEEKEREQQEKEKEVALEELELALDDERIKKAELQRLMNVVERFDEPVSNRIHSRFAERIAALNLADKRRNLMTIAAVLTTILIIGSIAAVLIFQQIQKGDLAQELAKFSTKIESGDLESANAYYQELLEEKPHFAQSPDFVAKKKTLDSKMDNERRRINDFQRFVADTREKITADGVSPRTLRIAIDDINSTEKKLARSDSEKAQLVALRSDANLKKDQLQTAIDTKFQQDVEDLKNRTLDLTGKSLEEIEVFKIEVEDLFKTPEISSHLQSYGPLKIISKRLNDYQRVSSNLALNQRKLQLVRKEIGNSFGYENALKDFVGSVKDGALAADFDTVLKEHMDDVKIIERWNRLSGELSEMNLKSITLEDCQAAISKIEVVINEFGPFPEVKGLAAVLEHLKGQLVRLQKRPLNSIVAYLEKNLFRLCYVERKSGKKVQYFVGPPAIDGNSLIFDEVSGIGLRKLGRKPTNVSFLKRFPDGQYYERLPHSIFAKEALKKLDKYREKSLELQVCLLLDYAYKATEVEPIVRVQVMQFVLSMAMPTSQLLEDAFKEFSEQIALKDVDLRMLDFLNVDPQVVQARQRLEEILETKIEQSPAEIYKLKIQNSLNNIQKIAKLPKIIWVGALMKQRSAHWKCELARNFEKKNQEGKLYVSHGGEFKEIGTVKAGVFKIDESQQAELIVGRPVFWFDQS